MSKKVSKKTGGKPNSSKQKPLRVVQTKAATSGLCFGMASNV